MAQSDDLDRPAVVYRRLLGYLRPYWRAFATAVTTLAVVAATETGFAALMKPLLDGSFVQKDPATIRLVPVLLLGLFLVRGIATFVSGYGMNWVARNIIRDLRREMFDRLLRLPTSFFDRTSSAGLTAKMISFVEQVASATTNVVTIVIRDSLTVVGLLAWMFYLSWKLSLVFVVVGPVIALLVVHVSRRFRQVSRRIQGSIGNVAEVAKEAVEGQRVVKIFGGQAHERERFGRSIENNRRQNMKMALTASANAPVTQLFGASALAVIIYLASTESVLQAVTVGTFMSFMAAMLLLMPPMKRLSNVNAALQSGIIAAQSVFQLIDEPTEVDEGELRLDRAQGALEYRNVCFSYGGGQEALSGLSFKVEAGQTVALVGHSGSGKSTLVSLLPRFYELTSGSILLDGYDIRSLRLEDLRQQIALVTQHVTLFNDTIRRNIAYGRLEGVTEQDIVAAAEAAYAMEFIRQLPQGLDTLVGENGVLLSGGQRQRLAIARALLKNAPILILDEATSALDTESERHIQSALERLMRHRTTLVIAHRLSTIENADLIIVMRDGRIVETGSHQELLNRSGHYARLHAMQFHGAAVDSPVAVQ